MIIKLESLIFRLAKSKSIKNAATPLTRAQWIVADRMVIATLFLLVIAAAIIF